MARKTIEYKQYFQLHFATIDWNMQYNEKTSKYDFLQCAICKEQINIGDKFIEPPRHLNNHIYDSWCIPCWKGAHTAFEQIN